MTELMLGMTSNFFVRFIFVLFLFVIGLAVSSAIDREPKAMGRFVYGLIVVFTAAIWNGAPGLWAAVSATNVDTASWVYLAVMAAAGLFLAFASRRRSVDVYGNAGNAYMAAIPLVNLVLIFKGSENKRTAARPIWVSLFRTVAFISLAVVAMLPGVVLQIMGKEGNIQPNIADLAPARAVKITAMINDAAAPAVIDKNTVLMGAKSEDMTLVLQYQLFGDVFDNVSPETFQFAMNSTLTNAACTDPIYRHLIKVGGAVRFQYDILKKGGMEKAAVTVSSC